MTNGHNNPLLTGIDLKPGLHCRNRIAMAAMTHCSAPDDESVGDPQFGDFASRSRAPGIVFTAGVSVSPAGTTHDGAPGAYDDSCLRKLGRWAQAIKDRGSRAILQIHHCGGMSPPRLVPNGDVVSPSGIATPSRSEVTPRSLTDPEIVVIIDSFAQATLRAIKAGFDGIQIQGGHGYLPQQFLSANTNRRDDRWGGSWERRCAFPLTLLHAAHSVAWDHERAPFAVGYCFTPEEALEDGLTMDEAIAFLEALIDAGLDYIKVLADDYGSSPRRGRMSKDWSRLAVIADAVAGRVPLLAGGSICTERDARDALAAGIDIVTLTMPDPFWRTISNAPGPGVG